VENQEFGHWKPLKIRDLESCENSQEGKRPRKNFFFWIYSICEEAGRCLVCWGKLLISCCYEHYFLSVRQGEVVETERTIVEESSEFSLMDSWSG
jgi:hypothetical protein